MRKIISIGLFCTTLAITTPQTYATPIAGDVLINASVDFDNALGGGGFSSLNNATNTGTLRLTAGGAGAASTFTGLVVAGADPLSGALTEIGDGIRVQASTSTQSGSFSIETLGLFNLQNTSGTDQYQVTLDLIIRSSATAEGPDAFAEVEIDFGTLGDPSGLATFEIISDTIAGNRRFLEVGGATLVNDALGAGGLVELFQVTSIDIILNPGQTIDLAAFWNWTSLFSNSFAGIALDTSINISAVLNLTNPDGGGGPGHPIPEPAPFGILLLGLTGLFFTWRARA